MHYSTPLFNNVPTHVTVDFACVLRAVSTVTCVRRQIQLDTIVQLQYLFQHYKCSYRMKLYAQTTFVKVTKLILQCMDSQTSEGRLTSADSKRTLNVPRHRQLRHQPTSITSDGGYSSQASMSTLGEDYCQRASSSLSSNSSASANSYHTAPGSVNMDSSPTSCGDSAPNFPEPLTAVPATNETMQQTKELLERLCGLVKNLETSHEKLSARVGDMEEKIKCLQTLTTTKTQLQVDTKEGKSVPSTTAVLPDVIEVNTYNIE